MPCVRLRVWDQSCNLSYTAPGRRKQTLTTPSLRLMARLLVGADPDTAGDKRQMFHALIDTGSPFNIIEKWVWDVWAGQSPVESLRPVGNLPDFHIGGSKNIRYQLGRVWLGVIDESNGVRLPAVPAVFQILDQSKLPHPVILGMHDGVLDNRWLRRVPKSPRQAAHETYDCGGYFGQEWYLQDTPPSA